MLANKLCAGFSSNLRREESNTARERYGKACDSKIMRLAFVMTSFVSLLIYKPKNVTRSAGEKSFISMSWLEIKLISLVSVFRWRGGDDVAVGGVEGEKNFD